MCKQAYFVRKLKKWVIFSSEDSAVKQDDDSVLLANSKVLHDDPKELVVPSRVNVGGVNVLVPGELQVSRQRSFLNLRPDSIDATVLADYRTLRQNNSEGLIEVQKNNFIDKSY